MSPTNIFTRFTRLILIFALFFSLTLSGCSYLPWAGEDDDDDLVFEEDLPFEDEKVVDRNDNRSDREGEDGFSNDDGFSDMGAGEPGSSNDDGFSDMGAGEDGFEDNVDGFASADERIDKSELRDDMENLQSRQEALISKVQEHEEALSALELRIEAMNELLESNTSSDTDGPSDFFGSEAEDLKALEPEIEDLKEQMAKLNKEIAQIKMQKAQSAPVSRKEGFVDEVKGHRISAKTPPEYNKALDTYRSGDYDESILLFQNLNVSGPPNKLKDNIVFWIGVNYVKLEMYDDAILQFETVLNKFPKGNKVHDSRYMLGMTYSKKGETNLAIELLEDALKKNPPAGVRGRIRAQLNQIQ